MLSTMVILYIQCHKVACQEFYLKKEGKNGKTQKNHERKFNMATIRKRGKTYQIDYFDPNGKRIRKLFKKKKDAEAELG